MQVKHELVQTRRLQGQLEQMTVGPKALVEQLVHFNSANGCRPGESKVGGVGSSAGDECGANEPCLVTSTGRARASNSGAVDDCNDPGGLDKHLAASSGPLLGSPCKEGLPPACLDNPFGARVLKLNKTI